MSSDLKVLLAKYSEILSSVGVYEKARQVRK
jgi:hypothetical protein